MNVTLGEIASFQKGFAFKSQDYVRSGHRIIRVSNLNKKDYRDSSCLFIDESKSYAYKKYSLYENDAVISTSFIITYGSIRIRIVSSGVRR